jgi:hygromycin-B 4-O-kinase
MFRPSRDIQRVESLLEERFGDVAAPVPLAGGEWSQAFGFRAQGRELVIRFGHSAEDYAKDRSAARFASSDLPIPRVVETGTAFDGVFSVSERAFGRHLDTLDDAGYQ